MSLLRPVIDQKGLGLTSQRARDRMVQRLQEQGISDVRVLAAMSQVPRHLFIDEALASRAYEDTALPIGLGQTISQPYVVALMTAALLRGRAPQKVLEIGTGCGYQAAILAVLFEQIYTVERLEELLRGARKRFRQQGLTNIRSKHADGGLGWLEEGPFDAVVVTAAGAALDERIRAQVNDGGVIVAPVGGVSQRLIRYQKNGGEWTQEDMGGVLFVPLLGGVA
jgi:protein-L-isoaspartate(D-aspartate) O-methyltransferase